MKSFATSLIAVSIVLPGITNAQSSQVISGVASVTDGDSLHINGVAIRLFGIDAFEHNQICDTEECGREATLHLEKVIEEQSQANADMVVCQQRSTDRYGRIVAICIIGEVELNRDQVRSGNAIAYRKYSSEYIADEDYARENKIGAWRYSFQSPEDFRKSQKYNSVSLIEKDISHNAVVANNCSIKGNINRKGEKIYHLPNTPNYEETNPEQMFCNIEDAVAAGFRAPRN